jgi:uncharacterized RmlC-like cupin family protein
MLIRDTEQGRRAEAAKQAAGVRIVKPLQLDDQTPQTPGVLRLAAVSRDGGDTDRLWAGVLLAEPGSVSAVHHHGHVETVVYVVSGAGKLRWGSRLEYEADWESGDFLFIPPHLPHQEINTTADRPSHWVVVRSAPGEVVVNLALGPGCEYVESGLAADESAGAAAGSNDGDRRIARPKGEM